MSEDERQMVFMYRRVVRKPREGTMTDAIKVHAQACGFVAYSFNVHPDDVAAAVAEHNRLTLLESRP